MHDDEGPGCQLEGQQEGESIRILPDPAVSGLNHPRLNSSIECLIRCQNTVTRSDLHTVTAVCDRYDRSGGAVRYVNESTEEHTLDLLEADAHE